MGISKNKLRAGFSLVELSIVLIIIGLLVAGVSGGSKLVRSAEINKIINDISSINIAYTTFYQTYDAIPGDFDEAESFWGGTPINNGDGDGKIEPVIGTTAAAADGDEATQAFLHLSTSEVLPGTYDPTIQDGAYAFVVTGGFGLLANEKDSAGTSNGGFASHLSGKNLLILGSTLSVAARAALNPGVHSGFLKPEDAYRIDKKMDDGLSASGNISYRDESATSTDGDVTAAGCASGTGYLLTSTSKACNVIFKLPEV